MPLDKCKDDVSGVIHHEKGVCMKKAAAGRRIECCSSSSFYGPLLMATE